MATPTVTRRQVLDFRLRQHQLDGGPGASRTIDDLALLDYGVQETGPDGAAWAIAVRGGPADALTDGSLALAWTLRGAPHAYRRADLKSVSVATAPYSEADASKRIFDASKPLKAAGIATLDALETVAEQLRDLAAEPIVKGDASGALNELLDEPFLRECKPCDAIHIYEMPFRLSALQAGLELQPETSPPVLARIPRLRAPMFRHLASEAESAIDVIRNHLRFYGPATVAEVATFIDAPPKVVKEHWPDDAVEVEVTDAEPTAKPQPRYVLDEHVGLLDGGPATTDRSVTVLGPYDPYLQLRDRTLLVGDEARRKALWPVIGRPGAVLIGGEVAATWRPRTAAKKLTLRIEPWGRLSAADRKRLGAEAERLAEHRGVALDGIVDE